MANNPYLRSGGQWSSTVLTASDMQKLDAAQKAAVNGDGGGQWVPASPIVIGGKGLSVPGAFSAGGTLDAPAFSLFGASATLAANTTFTLSPGARLQGPGAAFAITDGGSPQFTPARGFAARVCPWAHVPTGDTYTLAADGMSTRMAWGTKLLMALYPPPGAHITQLYFRVKAVRSANVAIVGVIPAFAMSAQLKGQKADGTTFQMSPVVYAPSDEYSAHQSHPFVVSSGGDAAGFPLDVRPGVHFLLLLTCGGPPLAGNYIYDDAEVSLPFIDGFLPELRTVLWPPTHAFL